MAVPPQGELHRPLLEISAEAKEALSAKQFLNEIVVRFSLTPEDLSEMIPSSYQSRILNRVVWGLYELAKAGLLERPSSGRYQITTTGQDYLKKHSGKITTSQLKKLVTQHMHEDSSSPLTMPPNLTATASTPNDDDTSPQDKIDTGYRELRDKLVDDLLDSISQISPEGFERLVVDLLQKMGYGKGQVVGKSGDRGIDGIINQDALGLEKVYIQAKRWKGQVSEPEIRNFSGSLDFREPARVSLLLLLDSLQRLVMPLNKAS